MNAPAKKPRADSRLKTLPLERQTEIAALLEVQSLATVRDHLASHGLATSLAALSEFRSWWELREALRRREERVAGLLEQMKRTGPEIPGDRLFELGQQVFGAMAIAEEDAKAWYLTQQTALKREDQETRARQRERELNLRESQVALDRERFQRETCEMILKAIQDGRAREIEASDLPREEKIQALRRHYFADVEALEKSGGVALPP